MTFIQTEDAVEVDYSHLTKVVKEGATKTGRQMKDIPCHTTCLGTLNFFVCFRQRDIGPVRVMISGHESGMFPDSIFLLVEDE